MPHGGVVCTGRTPTVWVRVEQGLRFFLAPQHRHGQIELRHDGTASVGHVVESLGIPLTEVGALLADGVGIPSSRRPEPSTVIEVRPVDRPQTVCGRFVLDVHLGKLARRLRFLGVDTAYRNDSDDDDLIAQSQREQRVLLTQDRGLLRRRALWAGAYVHGARPADQVVDVIDRFAPPLNPWTRCTACNGELAGVSKQDVESALEPGTRRWYDAFAKCRSCGQVYWRGAHARRLDAIVAAARSAHPSGQHTPAPTSGSCEDHRHGN